MEISIILLSLAGKEIVDVQTKMYVRMCVCMYLCMYVFLVLSG